MSTIKSPWNVIFLSVTFPWNLTFLQKLFESWHFPCEIGWAVRGCPGWVDLGLVTYWDGLLLAQTSLTWSTQLITVFSEEDKILIKKLYVYKGYFARQVIGDFPEKGWKLRSLNYLLRRYAKLTVPIENPEVAGRELRAYIRARDGHFEHLL